MQIKISAHCLIKNESRFVWYSIMSIIDHVDNIMIWDTGSSDETLAIINEIKSLPQAKNKIFFEKVVSEPFNESELRLKMIARTTADWILMIDADEIWWEDSIKKVTQTIRSQSKIIESIVVPFYNLVGDVYHYQEQEAGRYHLAGRIGHYSLRAFDRNISGLKTHGSHGTFAWMDKDNVPIENRDPKKICYLNAPFIHATFLKRSDFDNMVYKRKKKLKFENGIPFPKDFCYPEVFFREKPEIVKSPWENVSFGYKFKAVLQTPLKKIYRRTVLKYKKHGY